QLTKHSRGIHNARQFWFELALVFTAQWFSLGGMSCSPLNAALYAITGQPYLHHIKSLNLIVKSLIIYHGGLAMPGAFAHITA
ncbi:hypothetical protein ACJO1C_24685, partial [Vibrio parahaemolyticus]